MRSLVGSIVESRVTNLATTPVPYVGRHFRTFASGTSGGSKQNQMAQYGANGTLFGVVDRLSTSTAQVGWQLYRKSKSGKAEDRTVVAAHAALDLWNSPNPFYTQFEFVQTVQQHVDLTGEGWILVVRHARASIPLELWPIRPDRIKPNADPDKFCTGYTYFGPDGEEVQLGLQDIIRLRMPDPDNPYRGMGPVQALMRTLDRQRFSEEWNRNFFLNNAEPGGIIEVEERLGDEEFNEFRDRWAESHQGVGNAHRVAILENGMKWVERKYSVRDMQFAELEAIGPDKIREAYGFPKFAQGIVEDVNRASAEASDAMFGKWLASPRLRRWKDALTVRLLPMFGATTVGLEFDHDNPVPPDQEQENANAESKATTAETYIRAGFTGDSVKEALQLPEALVWEKPEPPAPPVAPGKGSDEPFEDRSVPALLARLVKNAAAEEDNDLQQVQDDWEAALAALLAVWAGVTAAQRAELAAQVQALVDAGNVAGLAALTATSDQGAAVLTAALTAMATTAAATAAAEAAAQGVEVGAVGIAAGDLAIVAAAVAGLLAAGLATAAGKEAVRLFYPGASGEEVAAGVTTHLEGLSDAYLREQLGGALTRAQNVGRLTAFQAAEAVNPQVQYSASEVLDKNTCKPCRAIDGTVFDAWINAWDSYAGGSYRGCLGGVRCRGTVVATWIGGA